MCVEYVVVIMFEIVCYCVFFLFELEILVSFY